MRNKTLNPVYQLIFQHTKDCILIFTKDETGCFHLIDFNQTAIDKLKFRKERKENTLLDILGSSSEKEILNLLENLDLGKTLNLQLNIENPGCSLRASCKIIKDNEFYILLINDMTKLDSMTEEYVQLKDKYQNIFENSQIGLFRTSISDGKILEANNKFASILGYESMQELHKQEVLISDMYQDKALRDWMLDNLLSDG